MKPLLPFLGYLIAGIAIVWAVNVALGAYLGI